MRKFLLVLICLTWTTNLPANSKIFKVSRVLIYTKNGEGYIHDNITASIIALQEICKLEKIDADSSEDPAVFTDENLKKYDAVIFSNANNDVFDTEEQKKSFQRFIRNGGGFIGIHSANAVERNWPWFWSLVGGKFIRHAPHQEFDVVVTNNNHPSTEFLDEKWTVEDECYYSNYLNPGINVLLSADLTTVEDPEKSTYPGDTFGNYFPLCWSQEFEGGRQWYTALGHDAHMYNDPTFRKHLRGGIIWVLGLKN